MVYAHFTLYKHCTITFPVCFHCTIIKPTNRVPSFSCFSPTAGRVFLVSVLSSHSWNAVLPNFKSGRWQRFPASIRELLRAVSSQLFLTICVLAMILTLCWHEQCWFNITVFLSITCQHFTLLKKWQWNWFTKKCRSSQDSSGVIDCVHAYDVSL